MYTFVESGEKDLLRLEQNVLDALLNLSEIREFVSTAEQSESMERFLSDNSLPNDYDKLNFSGLNVAECVKCGFKYDPLTKILPSSKIGK